MKRRQIARLLVSIAALVLVAHPAGAQPRFYFGGTVAADSADRGSMDLRSVPAAGGLLGWRFNDGWSIEFHLDRGFAEGDPHGRIGHFGTDTLKDYAREGVAVLAIWKSRPLGRVAVAASMGLAERRFRTTRTIGIDRPVNLPPDDPLLQNQTGPRRRPVRPAACCSRSHWAEDGRSPPSCASGSTSPLKASTAMASTRRCIRVSG